jgi:hypothetical protein
MNTELSNATALRINTLHATVMDSVANATNAVNAAMMASVEIGGHMKEMPRGIRMAWLRDNCPTITEKQIGAYLSIEATYRKRKNAGLDTRTFFALLDMAEDQTDEPTTDPQPTKSAMPQWIAWTGKLTGYFSEMVKQTPPSQWDEMQRAAVVEQLKPIVSIYESITKSDNA